MIEVMMKIPQGYKQTEIGIIPKDWEIMRLKDISTFSKGCGISRAGANSMHIPCVRYGEIYTSHDIYIKKFYSFISEDIAKCSSQIQKGDILFTASEETKELVIERKWIATLRSRLENEMQRISQNLTAEVTALVERYADTLPEIDAEVSELEARVAGHLREMGFVINKL